MPRFSKTSLARLATCHVDLQWVAHEAIREVDFVVLCGHRGEAEQREAFRTGHSKVDWPKSRHNATPSEAMDLAPYPLDWGDRAAFCALAVVVLRVADKLGVPIVWGGSWQAFKDLPHYELKR